MPSAVDIEPRSALERIRVVRFRLARAEWAIASTRVAGLAEAVEPTPVPVAAPWMVGLTSWRGHVLTTIDLACVLSEGPGDGPPCLVRLAPPHDGTAFWVPAWVRLGVVERDPSLPRPDGPVPIEPLRDRGRLVAGIDVDRIVERLSLTIATERGA